MGREVLAAKAPPRPHPSPSLALLACKFLPGKDPKREEEGFKGQTAAFACNCAEEREEEGRAFAAGWKEAKAEEEEEEDCSSSSSCRGLPTEGRREEDFRTEGGREGGKSASKPTKLAPPPPLFLFGAALCSEGRGLLQRR